jgi:tetratricopeptide (TPR) repeat protein
MPLPKPFSPIPFTFFFFLTLSPATGADFSLFPGAPTSGPTDPSQTLLIAVAPFNLSHPQGVFERDRGREFQHKIAQELRADRRLRVVELEWPVSEGPGHDLEAGFTDADRLLAQSGADLIIWGNEEGSSPQKWDIYVDAAQKVQNQVRQEGFNLDGTTYFSGVAEDDTLDLLQWAVTSWKGLIDHSFGMDIAPQVQLMIQKTDQALSLAYEKHWSGQTRLEMEGYLATLLCLYGNKTHDLKALDRAVSMTTLVLQGTPRLESAYNWACFQNNLGTVLQTRGKMEQSNEALESSVKAFQACLGVMPGDKTDIEQNSGESLEILGRREGNLQYLKEAETIFRRILKTLSPLGQMNDWMGTELELANTCNDMGLRETGLGHFREAIRHYQQMLAVPEIEGMPVELARVQTNLGSVYGDMGARTQNVEDYQKALDYLDQAIPSLRTMSSPQNLGIALLNRGTSLMNLGRLQNREEDWVEARQTYQEAASLFALSDNRMEWASIQRDLGNLDIFTSEKKAGLQGMDSAMAHYDQEQTVHTRKTMPLLWAQASEVNALALGQKGDSLCKPGLMVQAEQILKEAGSVMDPQQQAYAVAGNNQALAVILQLEGEQNHDPVQLRAAAQTAEKTLDWLKDAELAPKRSAIQSCLCQVYADLLALDPDGATENKAAALLKNLDPFFLKAPAPVDRYLHEANRAQLKGALALKAGDKEGLAHAVEGLKAAVGGIQKEGYVYYGARKEIVLGDMETALARLKGDKALAHQAALDYSKAREVLEGRGGCWKALLEEKVAQAQFSN